MLRLSSNPIVAMMLSFYSVCLSANDAQRTILDFETVLKEDFFFQYEIHFAWWSSKNLQMFWCTKITCYVSSSQIFQYLGLLLLRFAPKNKDFFFLKLKLCTIRNASIPSLCFQKLELTQREKFKLVLKLFFFFFFLF